MMGERPEPARQCVEPMAVTAYEFVIGRTCWGQVALLGSPLVFSPDFSVGRVGWFFFPL